MDKSEYIKWYKLASAAQPELIPPLPDNQIARYVSNEGWMVIGAPTGCKTVEDVKNSKEPNGWMHFYPDQNIIRMGVAFNRLTAVEKMLSILCGGNSEQFAALSVKLTEYGHWNVVLNRKTKKHDPRESPVHTSVITLTPYDLKPEKLESFFKRAKEIRKEGQAKQSIPKGQLNHVAREAPSIDIITKIPADENTFVARVNELAPLLKICWSILPERDAEDALIEKAVLAVPDWRDYAPENYQNWDEALYREAMKEEPTPEKLKKFRRVARRMLEKLEKTSETKSVRGGLENRGS